MSLDIITMGSVSSKMVNKLKLKTWVYDAANEIVTVKELQRENDSAHRVLLDEIDPPFCPYTNTFLDENICGSIKPDDTVEFESSTVDTEVVVPVQIYPILLECLLIRMVKLS